MLYFNSLCRLAFEDVVVFFYFFAVLGTHERVFILICYVTYVIQLKLFSKLIH